ncbi:hypothetical protein BLOT_010451 [Blomia tropicalis]|nr:hypothetical protein BLOT_010451 [Blomia tropicalis]
MKATKSYIKKTLEQQKINQFEASIDGQFVSPPSSTNTPKNFVWLHYFIIIFLVCFWYLKCEMKHKEEKRKKSRDSFDQSTIYYNRSIINLCNNVYKVNQPTDKAISYDRQERNRNSYKQQQQN